MSRTASPAPLDDRRMWRLLLARLHGDAGGSDELFVFGQAIREAISEITSGAQLCSRCASENPRAKQRPRGEDVYVVHEDGRVPFPESVSFAVITRQVLAVAEEVESIFAEPLRLLRDCKPMPHFAREQGRGATYKQLATIGHTVGMSRAERARWYKIAEGVSLSQRHAGYIISKLKQGAR